jgi:hypothetical protein
VCGLTLLLRAVCAIISLSFSWFQQNVTIFWLSHIIVDAFTQPSRPLLFNSSAKILYACLSSLSLQNRSERPELIFA